VLGLLASLALAASPVVWLGPRPPRRPARVATLAPSLTAMVKALGARDRLVAVSRYDDDPAVARLPRLGGLLDPSPEAILAARPELLVVQPSPAIEPVLARLAALGVPILELSLTTISDVEQAERVLGAALDVRARGEQLAHALEVGISSAEAAAQGKPRPRVLMVYGWSPLVVAGPGAFADALLRAAGGDNAASKARTAYAAYSVEEAAASKPALILDLSFAEQVPAAWARIPGLAHVRMVKPKSLALLHPGPELLLGLAELQAALATLAAPEPAKVLR